MMLSIIVPIYNCKEYVEACAAQFLDGLDAEFELLLIDDGSSDGSAEICDRLRERDSRVQCVHQPNGGVSSARNRGIELARGDYILFVDADDTVELPSLSRLLRAAGEDASADLFLFGMFIDYYFHGENYRSDCAVFPEAGRMDRAQWGGRVKALFNANYLSPVWNKLISRRRLLQSGVRFRPQMFLLEDLEFSARYLAQCDTVVVSDEAIYHYRQPEDEGNGRRRLMRIPSVAALLEPIDRAFSGLAESLGLPPQTYDRLLSSLYLSLAENKIWVSDVGTVKTVCRDFKAWAEKKRLSPELLTSAIAQDLLHGRTFRLLCRRRYLKTRNRAANRVKYWRYKRRKPSPKAAPASDGDETV